MLIHRKTNFVLHRTKTVPLHFCARVPMYNLSLYAPLCCVLGVSRIEWDWRILIMINIEMIMIEVRAGYDPLLYLYSRLLWVRYHPHHIEEAYLTLQLFFATAIGLDLLQYANSLAQDYMMHIPKETP